MINEQTLQIDQEEQEERSSLNFSVIYRTLILYWKWFLLSIIICLGAAFLYLRYTKPVYNTVTKVLIKEDNGSSRRGKRLENMANLGMINESYGIENEQEIIASRGIATQAVRDLKLYVEYGLKGRITTSLLYRTQPINVDMDPSHLEKLNSTIELQIKREGPNYHITGLYYVPLDELTNSGPFAIDRTVNKLPVTIRTKAGYITFTPNGKILEDGQTLLVNIKSPRIAGYSYVKNLTVGQTSKVSNILQMQFKDKIAIRGIDYLNQLAICYNRQANEDKNEVANRTEEFINARLEKINAELGETESQLESYKRSQHMTELRMNATQAMSGAGEYDQRLAEANTQMQLLASISDYMDRPENKYQTLPSNVGLSDATASSLINRYNDIVLQRNKLLRTASEESPAVIPLTAQLDDLSGSIRRAMAQSRKNHEIQRNAISSQYSKYTSQISATPEQERMLTQIGRQQEVRSGLYLMLLQKREENSISLASTADKGKIVENPETSGRVAPQPSVIIPIALVISLLLPGLVLFLLKFFRYKIEGHEDVARLTQLPIIADVAVASETAKTKADIVVHENKNNQMEEIFRAMRTNVQFMLREGQKVIMFTSTTSGEGKTFNCANLAVSFALLGKKVVLVGLDIRKPRLAELFEIDDHKHGITPLLAQEHPSEDDVRSQIIPSGVNGNLDLLLAGPVPPNPSELISRPSLEAVISILKDNYDYVLIDTAPVGLVTDTLQIGRVADATVYMCRADYTPKSSFDLINSLSQEKKVPNMSIAINGIDMSKKKYGYYYGYGKYGKYGRYGRYGTYGKYGRYGSYGSYGTYGYGYGSYGTSHYGNKNDTSVKR
jgi:capsular exopolysaccharide synthesis family protein